MLGPGTHHEPGHVLNEQDGVPLPVHGVDEVCGLFRRFGVHDAPEPRRALPAVLDHAAVVRDHPDGNPGERGGAANQFGRVLRLELAETPAVQNHVENRAHVVWLAMIVRQQVVEVGGRSHWGRNFGMRRYPGPSPRPLPGQPRDDLPQLRDARLVVRDLVVGDSADPGVDCGAPQRLAVDRPARGSLDQVGAAQAHEAGPFHHEDHVRKGGQIRASGDTRPHDRCELRDLQVPAHDGVVVEDPGCAVLSREHAILIREIHPRRVHQIDDRDTAAHRDFLGTQHLPDGLRPPRPRLDRRVVGDHDDLPPLHHADARHHTGARRASLVEVVGDEKPHFGPRRAPVQQEVQAVARREFATFPLPPDLLGAAAQSQSAAQLLKLVGELAHAARAANTDPPAGRTTPVCTRWHRWSPCRDRRPVPRQARRVRPHRPSG